MFRSKYEGKNNKFSTTSYKKILTWGKEKFLQQDIQRTNNEEKD